jgi:TonB-linked SusC/RagA family outer membrane protein
MEKKIISYRKDLFRVYSATTLRIVKLTGILMLGAVLNASASNTLNTGLYDESATELQQRQITGTVLGPGNETLPGVSIIVPGTNIGTLTDVDGKFTLSVPANATTLTFSFVGMSPQTVNIQNLSVVNITLVEDAIGLEEVLVVGYGTQRRADLTGAVSAVSGDEVVRRVHVSNTAVAMQGLSPGLTIQNFAGEPGREDVRVRVRGHGTLNNANPLVLVDGIQQSLASVEPRDIESISILKDAASASIYGSRAANGVILITTKRGAERGTTVSYDANVGWQNVLGYPEGADPVTWLELENEAQVNAGASPLYSQTYIDNVRAGTNPLEYPFTVWEDGLFNRNAPQHRHTLSLSTGGEFGRVFASVNFLDQTGLINNFGNSRLTARVNTDIFVASNLTANFDIMYRNRETRGPGFVGQQIIQGALHINRNAVGRYPDGTYDLLFGQWNPIAMSETGERTRNTDEVVGKAGLTYQITPELSLQGDLTIMAEGESEAMFRESLAGMRHYVTQEPVTVGGWFAVNNLRETQRNRKEWTQRAFLNFNQNTGLHRIEAMTGYEEIYNNSKWIEAYRDGFFSNQLRNISSGAVANQSTGGGREEWRLRSFFGRVNYAFDDKYLFQANLRYDGSSRFGDGHRWGLFPSFSAGWRISQEDFLIDNETISNLRLRASWGQLGNQDIGLYRYLSTYNLAQGYAFNNNPVSGAAVTSAGNPIITWETTTMRNIGADFGFFNNRVELVAEYFWNYTDDILLSLPIPPSIGVGAPTQNAAAVSNNGYEIALNYFSPTRTGNRFQYSVGINFSDVINKIEDLRGTGPYFPDGATVWEEGYSMNSLRGLQSPGIYRTQADLDRYPVKVNPRAGIGDIIYLDLNGDGVITQNLYPAGDQVIMGNEDPRYEFGITGRASYGSWDFSMFWQGVMQKYHNLDGALNEGPNWQNFIPAIMAREIFHPERNPGGSWPIAFAGNSWNLLYTEFWLQDTRYIRLKNIQLGYTLRPQNYFSNMRIYVAGENLLTFTPTELFDPETPRGRSQFFPHSKIFSAGLSVTF